MTAARDALAKDNEKLKAEVKALKSKPQKRKPPIAKGIGRPVGRRLADISGCAKCTSF